MAELKNYADVLETIITMAIEHDVDHTRYQEDIYMYIKDGVGSVCLFQNVGGNSWIDDDHITVMQLPQLYSDWTDFVPNLGDIADILEMSLDTLKERAAAWHCEKGWQFDASEMDYQDIREFIEAHPVLLNKITDAEAEYLRSDCYTEYADRCRMALDAALDEEVC